MRDELLDRIVDELRTLPPADEAAVRRIVSAAAADTQVAGGYLPNAGWRVPSARVPAVWSWLGSRVPLAAAAGFALVAGLAGYAIRGGPTPAADVVAAAIPAGSVASLASSPRSLPVAVATQFVLDVPRASRVALVGDFNGWDAGATPLARDASSGIWTVTVPLVPGRHVYAFMVDGTALTLDPRAPTAQDPEFGTPSSVVLVGTP